MSPIKTLSSLLRKRRGQGVTDSFSRVHFHTIMINKLLLLLTTLCLLCLVILGKGVISDIYLLSFPGSFLSTPSLNFFICSLAPVYDIIIFMSSKATCSLYFCHFVTSLAYIYFVLSVLNVFLSFTHSCRQGLLQNPRGLSYCLFSRNKKGVQKAQFEVPSRYLSLFVDTQSIIDRFPLFLISLHFTHID